MPCLASFALLASLCCPCLAGTVSWPSLLPEPVLTRKNEFHHWGQMTALSSQADSCKSHSTQPFTPYKHLGGHAPGLLQAISAWASMHLHAVYGLGTCANHLKNWAVNRIMPHINDTGIPASTPPSSNLYQVQALPVLMPWQAWQLCAAAISVVGCRLCGWCKLTTPSPHLGGGPTASEPQPSAQTVSWSPQACDELQELQI